jgi:hypothetical protein
MAGPVALATVCPLRVIAMFTEPVSPLKGTEKWLMPGVFALRTVGVL